VVCGIALLSQGLLGDDFAVKGEHAPSQPGKAFLDLFLIERRRARLVTVHDVQNPEKLEVTHSQSHEHTLQ